MIQTIKMEIVWFRRFKCLRLCPRWPPFKSKIYLITVNNYFSDNFQQWLYLEKSTGILLLLSAF